MIPNYFPEDARQYLREELHLRKRRRPHYSLRAFARDLEMSPSFLCEFLAGRQGLSRERVLWIGRRLNLSPDQREHFWDLVESRFGRTTGLKKAAGLRALQRCRSSRYRLSLDRFQFVADWYHFAILELLSLDGVEVRPRDLSQVLGISPAIVKEALKRLTELNLIKKVKTESGIKLQVRTDVTVVGDEGESRAIQMAHQAMLGLHAEAVDTMPISDRESLSIIFSISRSDW
ncbi:MAG: TIGR02147 family protein, partial [Bdellovibrionales bacterium]